MRVSLIITTYNWSEALELVLKSVNIQKILPNEVIIADDGSKADTKNLINRYKKIMNTPLIHSWQEDYGFRASRSRNKAISKAKYEYIVLIDGDIIMHKNFISDHIDNLEKGYFIQGSRVLIGKKKSNDIIKKSKLEFSFFENDIKNRKNTINNKLLSFMFSNKKDNLKGIRTCNMSFFQEDFIKINGFNEDFNGWGREDSELVVRFLNNNIHRKNIRFNCTSYHIWHNENTRTSLNQNDKILDNSIKNNLKYCTNGINNHMKGKTDG